MFILVHHQNFIKTISTKKLNYQHFIHVLTTIPCLRRFPPQILVWGNGPCRSLSHPPPPWPRGAARPRSRGRSGLRSAAVFCLGSCGPRPIHRQSPTEEEKIQRQPRWLSCYRPSMAELRHDMFFCVQLTSGHSGDWRNSFWIVTSANLLLSNTLQ